MNKHEAIARIRGLFEVAREHEGVKDTQLLAGYSAWRQALYSLGREKGVESLFLDGSSVGYVRELVDAGADPEHILAIATLVFAP